MPLPLIPIIAGTAGIAAGTALHAWLTSQPADSWEDKAIFNARMRDMQALALAINDGFSTCKAFRANQAQLTAWRGVRDAFSKFYGDTGTLVYSSPNDAQIEQAKSYASKFYFWTGEYDRFKCGGAIGPQNNVDPYSPTQPTENSTVDWAGVIKWSAIGVGGAFLIKTLSDLFRSYIPPR